MAPIDLGFRIRNANDRGQIDAVQQRLLFVEAGQRHERPHELHLRTFGIAWSLVVQRVRMDDFEVRAVFNQIMAVR